MSILIKNIFQRFKRLHSLFIVIPIISVFLILGFKNISYPGFYYDEVLYANSLYGCNTVGNFDTLSLNIGSGCFPILVMPYMGALKTYLLFFIKWFLTTENIYNLIRGFGLLISSISIYMFFKLSKYLHVSTILSITFTCFFAFNMSFLFGSKYDWGPIALSILLKVISLLVLIRLYENYNYKNWALFIFVGIIGTFNKIDFLFYIFPLVFTYLVYMHSREVYLLIKKISWRKITFPLVILFNLFAYIFYLVVNKIVAQEGFHFSGVGKKIIIFSEVLLGTSVLDILGVGKEINFYLILLLMVLLIVPFLFLARKLFYTLLEKTLVVSTLLYYLIIFALPFSGGPHHFISTFPMPFLLLSLVLNKFKNQTLTLLTVFGLIFYLVFNAFLYSEYEDSIKYYSGISWSKGSEVLYEYLSENHSEKRILITDWGIANQQILLSQGDFKIEEIFRPIRKMDTEEGIMKIQNYNKENSVAVKSYNPTFKNIVDNFDYSYYSNKQIIE